MSSIAKDGLLAFSDFRCLTLHDIVPTVLSEIPNSISASDI